MGHFCPPGSGSGSTDPSESGSATLKKGHDAREFPCAASRVVAQQQNRFPARAQQLQRRGGERYILQETLYKRVLTFFVIQIHLQKCVLAVFSVGFSKFVLICQITAARWPIFEVAL